MYRLGLGVPADEGRAFRLYQQGALLGVPSSKDSLAAMYKEGGWTPEEIAAHFDVAFGEHLQQIGIPTPATRAVPAK